MGLRKLILVSPKEFRSDKANALAYGARDILGVEQLEIDMCDKYLTWGWSSKSKTIHPFLHSHNYQYHIHQFHKQLN